MRSELSWHDVCILNVSLHGLGIQSAEPLPRGSYVEICRGRHTIVARVAWNKGHRAGLRSQDAIFIQSLVNNTHGVAPVRQDSAGSFVERRRAPRATAKRHEASRLKGRLIEFASFAVIVGALAMTAVNAVGQALNQPMSAVRAALEPSPSQPMPADRAGNS